MASTRQMNFRVRSAQNLQEVDFPRRCEGELVPTPELFGPAAIFPPVLTVYEVSRLLRMSVDSVRRIDRALLPCMTRGAGRWALYALSDVLAYVCKAARSQGSELDIKGRQQLIGEILGSARGRSRKGTSS